MNGRSAQYMFVGLALMTGLSLWLAARYLKRQDRAVRSFVVSRKKFPYRVPNIAERFNIINPAVVPSLQDGSVRCAILRTARNKRICIDTKDKFIGQSIVNDGVWEPHVWNPMSQLLSKDPKLNLIDIGANIGVYTLSVAAMGRRVVAVEAFFENIQRMSESLKLGGLTDKVTVVHNAVSDIYEDVYFWRPHDNPGGTHTLSKGVTYSPLPGYPQQPIYKGDHSKVKTIFMDDLIRIIPFKKAILKIDIETYEIKAFRKASVLLDKIDIPVVFMEWEYIKTMDGSLNIVNMMYSRKYIAHDLNLRPLQGSTKEHVSKWPFDIVWIKKQQISG